MTHDITTLDQLEVIYGTVDPNSLHKVASTVTAEYGAWISASRFCVLSTVGPEGTDGSPRGDDHPVVQIADETTLLMPDWRGNNRADSLRNIIRDPRVSLMFMVPGKTNVIRVNGTAALTQDPDLMQRFEVKGRQPRLVIRISVGEIYSQCARALIRSGLWSRDDSDLALPSMGDILRAQTSGAVDGKSYDANWSARAAKTMWNADAS
ncbi:pyridoxamine 5'-phosphate oxidase family protein [Shimia ponticola]|uniref:pyridoxamine 5'-phosphate oxidase family protein n=1 Tax=Shimia ponticola TaxID=2582893 RepID=UPI00164B6CA1|nr:pyridoxamine 5'-phosphate oxidase family protein [Shimia ponticola]